jgi:hypothetical protein
MDPVSVSALVAVLSKVLGSAADEAGRQLWQSLGSVVRRSFNRQGIARRELDTLPNTPNAAVDDPAVIRRLAAALAAEASGTSSAASALREWLEVADRTLNSDESVHNAITGTVHGTIIQARDIHGGITLHPPPGGPPTN